MTARRYTLALVLWSAAALFTLTAMFLPAAGQDCGDTPGWLITLWYIGWIASAVVTFAAAIASWWPRHRVAALMGGTLLAAAVIVCIWFAAILTWVDRCAQ